MNVYPKSKTSKKGINYFVTQKSKQINQSNVIEGSGWVPKRNIYWMVLQRSMFLYEICKGEELF